MTGPMTLLAIAQPVLAPEDMAWLEAFRRQHDPRYQAIEPHFTLVFGCRLAEPEAFLRHVRNIGKRTAPVPFVCRYAQLGSDDEVDRAYVFLVPDEGNSELSRLHDRLYTGPLAAALRLDLPYTPHITIGAKDDRQVAKRLCDDINERRPVIPGVVQSLQVLVREHDALRQLHTVPLSG